VTRACGLVGISRSVFRYESQGADLSSRLAALAAEKRRYGYRRLHVLNRREGRVVNWKRLYRLYRGAVSLCGVTSERHPSGRTKAVAQADDAQRKLVDGLPLRRR